jgi:hypothetical protein
MAKVKLPSILMGIRGQVGDTVHILSGMSTLCFCVFVRCVVSDILRKS